MTVGERIKQRRLELGLTQDELAQRMGYKGKTSVCVVETGGDNVTTTKVKKFAKALDVSIHYLLGDIDDTPEAKKIRDAYINDTLSSDDRELLELYHIASPEAKAMVDFALKRIKQIP